MALTASIIIPTRHRAGYLDVALASIAPQAAAAGAEMLVVDDGPGAATRAAAQRHGARYVAHDASRGLNAARNTGIDSAQGELLVFVDDDVAVRPGWLRALLDAHAEAAADVGVLTGPIHARFEDHRFRGCGRESPPITTQDHGLHDRDVDRAWGANMTVRRSALDRAGRFDEAHELYGDEQEWQERLRATGARIRYVAGAALDHRRAGDDARLRSLAAAAYRRGQSSRRFDHARDRAPSLARELRVLAGCALHGVRYRCPNGVVLAAHELGRVQAAMNASPGAQAASPGEVGGALGAQAASPGEVGGALGAQAASPGESGGALGAQAASPGESGGALGAPAPPAPGDADFLSGTSGTVRGLRRPALRTQDALLDLAARPAARRLARAARDEPPRRSVLVLGVERPDRLMDGARIELHRTRHAIEMHTATMGDGGKFEHLNRLLAKHPPAGHDWLVVIDDDVVLPRGFLDRFLHCTEDAGLLLAAPAHRLHSHAAWQVTRRQAGGAVRESRFAEIGPLTAFAAPTFEHLLPFPPLAMGWGLDVHWGALARDHGWPVGIVDATPILHTAPVAGGYPWDAAVDEARAFLADRPYVTRVEAAWSRRLR